MPSEKNNEAGQISIPLNIFFHFKQLLYHNYVFSHLFNLLRQPFQHSKPSCPLHLAVARQVVCVEVG